MGAGYSRINSLTIIQTSQGLADYLLQLDSPGNHKSVIIGHDSRHNSDKFARLTAAAFLAKGFKIWWYGGFVHTPLVPFAIKSQKAWAAMAGIMITASHNPAQDNGYKVYGSNGCQINSPVDRGIAESILKNLEPITYYFDDPSPSVQHSELAARSAYKKDVAEYLQVNDSHKIPAFVYTPMHGVGLQFMIDMLGVSFNKDSWDMPEHGIHQKMTLVTEQSEPDPDFSTVKYPNPEEDGALDLAKKTADRDSISLIVANDPDADRFAAAEKVNSKWHQFTGDQVGILLAYHILTQLKRKAVLEDVMLTSAVSSMMLSKMGQKEGFTVTETLTGFKWIGSRAYDLENENQRVHFGYEEALGYMFPSISYDKDGIVAAGVFLKACAEWGSPYAKLQELYQKYGHFETMNTYWRSSDVAATQSIFGKIRNDNLSTVLPQFTVKRKRDLSTGFDSGTWNGEAVLPSSPSTQMITFWLTPASIAQKRCEGGRFTIRASGTEPKIKIYLECWDSNAEKARAGAATVLKGVKQAFFNDKAFVIEEKYKNI